MKSSAKGLVTSYLLLVASALTSCEPQEGFIHGRPASGVLMSDWRLDSIVTPTGKMRGKDIGYSELLRIKSENRQQYEKTFHNDSLVNTQYWTANPPPVIDTKKVTFYITYRYKLKRFYKIRLVTSAPDIMEATGYVNNFGSKQDSVRYFYTQIWKL